MDDTMLASLLQPHTNALPNCFQLHKDMQVSWEIFGPQITIQLAGQVGEYHAVILRCRKVKKDMENGHSAGKG